ncbi:MAG TPA: PEP-CTERM sorting domain-containing protein [Candidatus Acidoferrales bacterium]|jgi:hypothetical protein|nr:PEP-CTERM sorting domain-containing protein [Candidatus Acidoferrales bacterium]
MKKAIILAAATTFGSVYLSPSALAQTTIYNDNFASDSALSSSYVNIDNISATATEWSFTPNSELTLTTAASGKIDELVGSFSAVTLNQANQYVSFIVNFNSPNIGQSGSAGSLLTSLDYSGGAALNYSPEQATQTTNVTAGYVGDLVNLAMNNTPKTGTKFFAKTGTGNNDLSYNSDALPDTQLSTTEPNSANANLLNNDAYTLTYTITSLNTGGSQEEVTEQLYDHNLGAMVDNFSVVATNGASFITPTTTYDTFDMGVYTGSETAGYNLNLTSLSVVTGVPEPTALALTGAGMGLAYLIRFRRR